MGLLLATAEKRGLSGATQIRLRGLGFDLTGVDLLDLSLREPIENSCPWQQLGKW